MIQRITIEGGDYVLLRQADYDRLRAAAEKDDLPPLPEADADGNRPAIEFMRATMARGLMRDRKALGLSQAELARLAGVRIETLCRLEAGKHSPHVATVDKIERAFERLRGKAPAKKNKRKPSKGRHR